MLSRDPIQYLSMERVGGELAANIQIPHFGLNPSLQPAVLADIPDLETMSHDHVTEYTRGAEGRVNMELAATNVGWVGVAATQKLVRTRLLACCLFGSRSLYIINHHKKEHVCCW